MWEALNVTYNRPARPGGPGSAHRPVWVFRFVRERAAVIAGLTDSTMIRDDAWRFLVLGRSLERVDMLARLLSTAFRSGQPTSTGSCCCAPARRTRPSCAPTAASPNPTWPWNSCSSIACSPRSVFYALSTAESCLAELDPSSDRAGMTDEPRRILGRLRTQLEIRRIDDLLQDFPGQLDALQAGFGAASAALAARYFRQTSPIEWTHERVTQGAGLTVETAP